MKKVKVMLAAIAVLAVIGGTFAFKAKTAFNATLFTTTTGAILTGNACNVENDNVTTTTLRPGSQVKVYYTVSTAAAPCFTPTSFYTTTTE